jgi:FkbM family methyltransferase
LDNNKGSVGSEGQDSLSPIDYIISHVNQFKSISQNFFRIRKSYVNYMNIVMAIKKNQYPIKATLRRDNNTSDGVTIFASNLKELLLLAHLKNHKGLDYDPKNEILTIRLEHIQPGAMTSNGKKNNLIIHGCGNNGDIVSVFIEKKYQFLPVTGKVVIDIGANIADSAIYFCLRGAARVIGLEPFPHNYEIAKRNIESNNLSTKVSLLLAGLGAISENISIDPSYSSDEGSRAGDSTGNFEEGIKIPMLTLEDIINKYNLNSQDVVLKVDCEGCEYESLILASKDVLRIFDHIQIEYHRGYKKLKEKLEKCDFKVSVERPLARRDNNLYLGFIYATRK